MLMEGATGATMTLTTTGSQMTGTTAPWCPTATRRTRTVTRWGTPATTASMDTIPDRRMLMETVSEICAMTTLMTMEFLTTRTTAPTWPTRDKSTLTVTVLGMSATTAPRTATPARRTPTTTRLETPATPTRTTMEWMTPTTTAP